MADTKDIRSKFRLEFEAKGAERVQRQAEGVNKALGKEKLTGGMSELERLSKRNVRQMAGLSKHLKEVTKALQGMSKAAKQIGTLADKLKKASDNAKGVGDNARRANAELKKGAFTQGFAQGMGVGPFLQRGPGMRRQAAGMVAGGAMRGAAAMPVRGSQAFAQGLASIPGGGLVGAAMQNAFGAFQSALAQEAGITGLGGMPRAAARRAASRARAGARADPRQVETGRSAARARFAGSTGVIPDAPMDPLGDLDIGGMQTRTSGTAEDTSQIRERQLRTARKKLADDLLTAEATALVRAQDQAAARARKEIMSPHLDPIRNLQRTAASQGIMPQQALQMAQQMGLSTLDPTLSQAQSSIGSALGLQRLGLGGAGEAGAFLRAERRGGIQGVGRGAGAAGRALDETVGRAFAMGLDRSEIRDLLGQIAQGQERFFTTGVPFARESILAMTAGLSGAMGEGLRSIRTAQALQQGAQSVGARGPQNAAQVQLVRQIAQSRGFGFSAEGMSRAMMEMESGGVTNREVQSMLDRMGMPGGAFGAQIRKRFLAQAFPGMEISGRESLRMGETGIGAPGQSDATFDLEQQARGRAAGMDIRRAGQARRRIGIGQQVAPSVQTFEDAMLNTSKGFAKLAPSVEVVANGVADLALLLPKLTGWIQEVISDPEGAAVRAAKAQIRGDAG